MSHLNASAGSKQASILPPKTYRAPASMATTDGGASTDAATKGMQNLHLDPVTGDHVSKSELKKRQKQRELEQRKAEKAASAPTRPEKRPHSIMDEQNLTPNQFYEIRCEQIKRLKQSTDPQEPKVYIHKFDENMRIPAFIEKYQGLKKGETLPDTEIRLMGRIFGKRESGAKLKFLEIEGNGKILQVMGQAQEATGNILFEKQYEYLRRGDFVGIKGFPGRTSPKTRDTGELSIFAREVSFLTPCLHLLPNTAELSSGFTDPEQRFRERYLDFMVNPNHRRTIKVRKKAMSYIRAYFDERDFDEVETPMMNAIAGGATARPFKTYINEYKQDMFMRIAPELYLKMLIVGGFEGVYELGRQFRNEGADLTHNPEFTSVEMYRRGWDYYDVMDMTEELVSGLVKSIHGTYHTTYDTMAGEKYEIDWSTPWKRVEIIPALEEATGKKFPPGPELHTEATNDFLKALLKESGVQCTPPMTNTRMLDKLIGEFIEEKCINPTFIIDHPQVMSPLAKAHREKPGLCERFEAFVAKKEIANAYTELNDPFEQRLRFEEQARQKAAGDDEAQLVDELFCRALEYGLPPTGGWGLGLDRLVMFLCNENSIREVLAFPFMKDDGRDKKPLAAEVAGVEPLGENGSTN